MTEHPLDVAVLGQVFTEPAIVQRMLSLKQNQGRCLEPSAGAGAFSQLIPGCVAVEYDARVAPPGALVMDFFDFPVTEQFDTIIGNPPYVRFQDITAETRAKLQSSLFDKRSNLYLFFIAKCVAHLKPGGELIFIVPRELAKLTAAHKLNPWLLSQGSFTHYEETGDSRIFKNAVPNCVIFRYVKGDCRHQLEDGRQVLCHDGQLVFASGRYTVPLRALFDVKVGAVSGADDVFVHPEGNREFVYSGTRLTGQPRRAFHGAPHPQLLPHKDRLLARKIRHFNEQNWWHWGRECPNSAMPRIYVNAKTRQAAPFFQNDCLCFDGSVLALFPRKPLDLAQACRLLNEAVNWNELGFLCDGRYLFSQRTLQHVLLPSVFEALLS